MGKKVIKQNTVGAQAPNKDIVGRPPTQAPKSLRAAVTEYRPDLSAIQDPATAHAMRTAFDYIYQLRAQPQPEAPQNIPQISLPASQFVAPTPSINPCIPPELSNALISLQLLGNLQDLFGIQETGQDEIVVRGDYIYAVSFSGVIQDQFGNGPTTSLLVFAITDRNSLSLKQIGRVDLGSTAAQRANRISNQGRYCFLTAGQSGLFYNAPATLVIVDVFNPEVPAIKSTTTIFGSGATFCSFPLGQYVYITGVSAGGGQFAVVDITNPAAPVIKSTLADGHGPFYNLFVRGPYAYLCQADQLQIFDISNPVLPVHKSTFVVPCIGIFVDDIYAYCASSDIPSGGTNAGTFSIVDVSDPVHPALLGQVSLPIVNFANTIYPNNVSVSGDKAVVSGDNCPITLIDITSKTSPTFVTQDPASGLNWAMQRTTIQGRLVWGANTRGGLIEAWLLGGFDCHQISTSGLQVYDMITTDIFRARQGEYSGPVTAQSLTVATGGGIHCAGNIEVFDGTIYIGGKSLDTIIDERVKAILRKQRKRK